jgi:hypothetical protein
MINIKIPPIRTKKEIEKFFNDNGLSFLVTQSKTKNHSVNTLQEDSPYKPNLDDLYQLYQYVVLNKRTTVLEFGSGWSSLIFSLALRDLKKINLKKIKNLRRNNPFELFILENEIKYLNITKKRILKFNKILNLKNFIKINYYYSEVEMTLFNNKISTQYKKLPLCNPDFIYIDGPDQFKVKKNINGINTGHKDMMPMICDVLKFEYFYTPGTIIVVDGRGANAKFLKDNFQRKWKYINDKKKDQHIFLLIDQILGKYNLLQNKFYNK